MDKQEWFSLPYVTGNFGNVGIEKVGDDYELVPQNIPCRTVWVGTAWPYIAELLSQVELAHGRVLCTGLGLGLVPLLIAEADNVDHVWVVENDPDVISAFFVQGFDLSKITILECDADEVQGVFDFIALDHYNGFPNGMHGFVKMTQSFKARFPSSDVIAYLWPTLHTYTKAMPSSGWGKEICLPKLSDAQVIRYSDPEKNATDAIPELSRRLKRIDEKRNLNVSPTVSD